MERYHRSRCCGQAEEPRVLPGGLAPRRPLRHSGGCYGLMGARGATPCQRPESMVQASLLLPQQHFRQTAQAREGPRAPAQVVRAGGAGGTAVQDLTLVGSRALGARGAVSSKAFPPVVEVLGHSAQPHVSKAREQTIELTVGRRERASFTALCHIWLGQVSCFGPHGAGTRKGWKNVHGHLGPGPGP